MGQPSVTLKNKATHKKNPQTFVITDSNWYLKMQVYFQPAGFEQQEGCGCTLTRGRTAAQQVSQAGSFSEAPFHSPYPITVPDWATPPWTRGLVLQHPASTPAIGRSWHLGPPGTLVRNKLDNSEQDLCNPPSLFLDPQSVPLIQNLPPSATPIPCTPPAIPPILGVSSGAVCIFWKPCDFFLTPHTSFLYHKHMYH